MSTSTVTAPNNMYAVKIAPWIMSTLDKHDPKLAMFYREFLIEYMGGEVHDLLMDVEKFKEEADENQVRIAAMQLYDKYWSPISEYTLKIKPTTKSRLAQQIDSWNIALTIFDDAVKELEEATFKSFQKSDTYASFMADHGVTVRTFSPRRRVSITDLFKRKDPSNLKRSTLSTSSWTSSGEFDPASMTSSTGSESLGASIDSLRSSDGIRISSEIKASTS